MQDKYLTCSVMKRTHEIEMRDNDINGMAALTPKKVKMGGWL